ncbi:Exocyst complex protein Exo70 protein [Raphanus sativus]|nr:Exocyst complex protein Exo70 protein [Raphanus sativus]
MSKNRGARPELLMWYPAIRFLGATTVATVQHAIVIERTVSSVKKSCWNVIIHLLWWPRKSYSSHTVHVQASEIQKRLAEVARGILSEFENSVLREPSVVPVPEGTVHPFTRQTLNDLIMSIGSLNEN